MENKGMGMAKLRFYVRKFRTSVSIVVGGVILACVLYGVLVFYEHCMHDYANDREIWQCETIDELRNLYASRIWKQSEFCTPNGEKCIMVTLNWYTGIVDIFFPPSEWSYMVYSIEGKLLDHTNKSCYRENRRAFFKKWQSKD